LAFLIDAFAHQNHFSSQDKKWRCKNKEMQDFYLTLFFQITESAIYHITQIVSHLFSQLIKFHYVLFTDVAQYKELDHTLCCFDSG
jgi:hypothetical protein